MNATLELLSIPADSHPAQLRRFSLAVALVSFSALLLELSLTRIFSVTLFYHFAFLAISVALLGLGAGGVLAFIRREWLKRYDLRTLGFRLCIANAIAILTVLEIALHVPISLDITVENLGRLTAVYLAAAVPFFFVGLLFSVVFAREHRSIAQLYGWDLVGGAAACLVVVPLLNLVGGPNAVVCAALAMSIAAFTWADAKRRRQIALTTAVAMTVLLLANRNGQLIDIVYAKGARRDQAWMEFAKWNAISRVEVNNHNGARYIVIDADANTAIMNVDPKEWESPAGYTSPNGANMASADLANRNSAAPPSYNWKKDLMSAAPAIANVLRPKGDYAIIGPGGGVDVLRAVATGSPKVVAIEINPIIAGDIMRGRYQEYSHGLYTLPQVHIHVGDGRSWIRNSRDKFDVIQMTLVDTWASTAAGAFALSENNLYTVEAFKEYFAHLKDDGFIAITRWEFAQPREALRVVSQAIEALRQLGVDDPRRHFLVVSDGELNVDGRPVTVLAKKTRFYHEEEIAVNRRLRENRNLYSVYTPHVCYLTRPIPGCDFGLGCVWPGLYYDECMGPHQDAGTRAFATFINAVGEKKLGDDIAWSKRQLLIEQYPYDISPVTDNAPFFFFTLKTGDVLKQIFAGTGRGSGRGIDWRINLGITVLFMLLAISIVAVIAFLIVPLAMTGARAGSVASLLYFVAVGLGYILVEVALIQRFVLFLGHPTYALTVVIFLMLLSSGLGSMAARRWLTAGRLSRLRWALLGVIAIVAFYLWLLPLALGSLIGLPIAGKLAISALMLVPLGFLMGMPFPTGLRALGSRTSGDQASEDQPDSGPVEWAWAMNAGSTVLGSVSAMVIAIHFGIAATLTCGAAAYLLAMGLAARFKSV